jgi:GNAT superfamily N-acetyltransferase
VPFPNVGSDSISEVPDPERPTRPTWYARRATLASGLHLVSAHQGDEAADGTTLHEGRPALWSTEPSDHGMIRLATTVPDAPPAWFVSVDEPRAMPPAANLVAYVTDDFPPGTVINRFRFGSLGLSNDDQAGAIRWFRQDGLIHQIFVAPVWRRHSLGTVLVYAASAFHQANGWGGRIHADGRRTEQGERFAVAFDHPGRVEERTETMPSMDSDQPASDSV